MLITTLLNKSGAFLFGFGVSLLPAVGPFVAVLFFLSSRWKAQRRDLLWGVAAALSAIPLITHQGSRGLLFGLTQIAAVWLVFRAFAQLRNLRLPILHPFLVGMGLILGLALIVVLNWLNIDQLNFTTSPTIAEAIVWGSSPALYGHTVLTLGGLIAIMAPDARFRILSLGLSALGILVSGSREAAIAWVFLALFLLLVGARRSAGSRLIEVGMLVVMLLIAAELGPQLGWGRVGFLVDLAPASSSPNLLQGTEVGNGDWWIEQGVDIETTRVEIAGRTLTSYLVSKTAPEQWRRLQQVVTLEPGATYTVSSWIRSSTPELRPGFQGWGPLSSSAGTFILTASLRGESWRASVVGPGRVLGSGVIGEESGWRRVWVTFVYQGSDMLYWWLGLAPDQRNVAGTSAEFTGFQLEPSAQLTDYQPGSATRGLGLRVARIPFWQAAWQGIREKPLLGWGPDSFPGFYLESGAARARLQEIPAHTHNLFVQMLFERGLVGLLGLLLFLTALCWNAVRRLDFAFLAVVLAVLIANVFDYTLFYGGVLYPLAAAAGWRSSTKRARPTHHEESARQVGVNLTLALTDLLVAFLSLELAMWFRGRMDGFLGIPALVADLPRSVFYALLLWPVAAWREGIYPGYGLTPPQELRKQVVAAGYAGLILATGALLFPQALPLPRSVLLLMMGIGPLLLPIGRVLAKQLLLVMGLWGRPVVILGAGKTGRRITKALLNTPMEGLHPLALFDDDPAKHGLRIEGLRVVGPLVDAEAFAKRCHVTHAIVAIPSLPTEMLARLVGRQGKTFRRVQFVPELAGMPVEDVLASNLDGMLTIEVRNGLYARRNRLLKRAIDLLGSLVGGILISPLLFLLYLWIRFDSRGPAFYWSERIGRGGKPFQCLKFRTMYVDADERLGELLKGDPRIRQEYETYHKLERDPRVTRAGRILRKYSLDEIAQLYNVLVGEMSLVGPRPYLTRELEDMRGFGEDIFEAKPGMTGYWQVGGRNSVTFQDRLKMEAHYVRNWSPWWDIIIMAKTFPAMLRRREAS